MRQYGLSLVWALAVLAVTWASDVDRALAQVPVAVPVTATVNTSDLHQRIDGFGGALAYYGDWVTRNPYHDEIYEALFSPTKGMGLSILRLQNYFRYQKTADGQPDPNFDKVYTDLGQAAQKFSNRSVAIMLCSWSPPAFLKSNSDERHGGTLVQKNGAYDYAGFGKYWRDSVIAYRRAGVSSDYVSIQNEPDWKADWDSCLFKPTEQTVDGVAYAGYDRALAAVAVAIRSLPHMPKLVGPDVTGIVDNNVENYIAPTNATELDLLYAVCHHLYNGGKPTDPDSFVPMMTGIRTSYPDKPKWQTEFGEGSMVQFAWLINNSLAGEDAGVYLFWALAWPGNQQLISVDDPTKPQSTWNYPHGYRLNDYYYALEHFSRFIRPGYRRAEAASSDPAVRLSAFVSPDAKTLVLVLINTSAADSASVRLDCGRFSPRQIAVYRSTASDSAERFVQLDTLPVAGPVALPPMSMATVVERR